MKGGSTLEGWFVGGRVRAQSPDEAAQRARARHGAGSGPAWVRLAVGALDWYEYYIKIEGGSTNDDNNR